MLDLWRFGVRLGRRTVDSFSVFFLSSRSYGELFFFTFGAGAAGYFRRRFCFGRSCSPPSSQHSGLFLAQVDPLARMMVFRHVFGDP